MHVPDGFINAPVSVAAGAVAVGAVAVSLRGARREQGGTSRSSEVESGGERTAPLAGLVAAFIFAVQMLNFPVAAGTSGHLLGGALAAILVGPYTAVLCVSVVLLMQGLLFADGGLTALGVNITVMGCVTTVVAYAVFRGLVKVLPRTRRSVTAASFVAACVVFARVRGGEAFTTTLFSWIVAGDFEPPQLDAWIELAEILSDRGFIDNIGVAKDDPFAFVLEQRHLLATALRGGPRSRRHTIFERLRKCVREILGHAAYAATCSAIVGGSMCCWNSSSVRNRPTPSAVTPVMPSRWTASSGERRSVIRRGG